MTCALCLKKEATKKNTHYLTDGIIRNCLNLEGSNDREKGFYFDLSSQTAGVEFNFQRATSVDELQKALGREPTNEEIAKAKKTPFSVDYIFCPDCEEIFTGIETNFIQTILPEFRNADLNGKWYKTFDAVREIRLFFYIQIWRTSVCDPKIELDVISKEKLRLFIFGEVYTDTKELTSFPLLVIYLQTLGGEAAYTSNMVGLSSGNNPYLIFFNDFIIQFFDTRDRVLFDRLHGINTRTIFEKNVNFNEIRFSIPILKNKKRKSIFKALLNEQKVKETLELLKFIFNKQWSSGSTQPPPFHLQQRFITGFLKRKADFAVKYSAESIADYTNVFFHSLGWLSK